MLDDALQYVTTTSEDCNPILMGDLNARTQGLCDYLIDDSVEHTQVGDWYPADDFDLPRNSCDLGDVNKYGQSLISLCHSRNIHLANGRMESDQNGNYTCIAPNGCSVVDYIILSSELLRVLIDFDVVPYDSDSCHLPLRCVLKSELKPPVKSEKSQHQMSSYKWNDNYSDAFFNIVSTHVM